MTMSNPKEGFQNSQAYVCPGIPFVYTGSGTGSIAFPNVTRSLAITAKSADASIYFQTGSAGITARKFIILSGTTVTLDLRVRDIFYQTAGTVSILAGCTMIDSSCMPQLTSSMWAGI